MREFYYLAVGSRSLNLKFMGLGWIIFWLVLALGGCAAPPLASGASLPSEMSNEAFPLPSVTSAALQSPSLSTPTPTVWDIKGGVIVEATVPLTPTAASTHAGDEPLEMVTPSERVLLENVPIGKQTRPLNCEFQSASDLLWYYGYPYMWDEIFELVGHDPGGNPHKGFVGRSFDDPPGRLYPNGYGVYAEPIVRGLAKVGIKAEVHYDEDVEWLKEQIRNGNPVMVWATANMVERQPEYWTAEDGQRIKAVRGEHTYLVIGYDEKGVWVADPWVGRRRHFSWPAFLASWDILNRMSLIIIGPETPEP